MLETAPATRSQTGRHRGRGRNRGSGRGRHNAPRHSDAATERNQAARPSPSPSRPEPVVAASSGIEQAAPPRDGQSSRERGRGRGRQGGGRRGRGGTGQRSMVVSHRGGRGPPQVPGPGGSGSSEPGLRVTAPEFVPGQPVAVAGLTTSSASTTATALGDRSSRRQAAAPAQKQRAGPPSRVPKSTAPDLTTRIHEDINNHEYECVICTNEVLRNSKVWACPICWTVTHLHCVKKWHANQAKEKQEDQERGQNQEIKDCWRCPGCNSTLIEQPGPYRCWCGKDTDPKPIAGLPPHSCGQTCSKSRDTCPHRCSLMCHAGPCPPCTLMGPTQACFCGKNTSTKRCSETDYGKGWSCQEPCGDLLPCGQHTCTQPCHAGLCGACEIPMLSACYCGKEQREMPCSQRDDVLESFDHGQRKSTSPSPESDSGRWFEGSFRCSNLCSRPYDCGLHTCQKPCHPQDEATAHCPFSPDVVTHCPCGKTTLESMSVAPRQACQDPVPHCDKPCNKVLACGHRCPDRCHTGSCAPCTQHVDVTCRCGRTTGRSMCHQGHVEHPLCFRVCRTKLNCGRHECSERCCSGERKAAERRKQKRTSADENYEPEHICLQVCGRPLKCGMHTCQQLCHKGPCMSCPEAIFDEISCSCGRTVLQPPQPCGTKVPECRFPCTRPRPCGHPAVQHQCHSDDTPCPKCPFLVERPCICGKQTLRNQPCWFEDARCGLPCGKKLKCGAHECRKPCHKPGECEDAEFSGSHCPQRCGKTRKSCEHACEEQCHAPYPCKEDKPCQYKTFITCPCQRRKQEVRCQATKLSPWSTRETTLECDDECLRLQRNRKLAEALDIDPDAHSDDHIPYGDFTLKFFRDNTKWAQEKEREFRDFAAAPEEKRLRFRPMPSHQRAFLHALAEDFGLDSESQDPEPHRHVCIFKTPRFVSAPHKTLAQCLRIAKAASTLAAGASSLRPAAAVEKQAPQQAFNALLLRNPRFGLTIDELNAALSTHLASSSRSTGPALTYTTSFLPSSEKVLIKATPVLTAAAVATSLAPTPQEVESILSKLKVAVAQTVSRLGLAGAVSLCHVDTVLGQHVITRGEDQPAAGDASGWSAVASRGSWKKVARMRAPAAAALQPAVASGFVALRKLEVKKKNKKEEAAPQEKEEAKEETVVDDWRAAAEEEEEKGKTDGSESGGQGSASEDGSVENGRNDSSAATVQRAEGGEGQDETRQGGLKQVEPENAVPGVAMDV
ncbi:uncharacterized protein B0T15DRAFT_5444 [Chaetomium strumarium]|uniref:R3H domain-containing protein n=1 Tax=Chaetomium strumarium TaxID=1170767 RepID=A0AAJ0H0G0_9PEZI|nr:hypothetical protein B0T15DRAFT_5444 [Chaetomium strumarium]